MRYAVLLLLVLSVILSLNAIAHYKKDNPEISFAEIKDRIEQFDILELNVDFNSPIKNPFDPDEVDIRAHLMSPSQKDSVVPAFYYQKFSRDLAGRREILTRVDLPGWKVRFAPSEIGTYRVFLTARFGGKEVRTEEKSFDVVRSKRVGFVKADTSPYLFFDSGQTYFGIGENVGWVEYGGTYGYDSYFEKLSDNECNLVRIWMVPWNLALEWTALGRYNLQNAWRLDHILEEARKRGIYVILVLGNYDELSPHKLFWNEPKWGSNPYNVANDGPCFKPEEFWTNQEARDYYKRRLRYIIARWGAYTNLLAFELWNETNAPVFWVKEMSDYIKNIDSFGHCVTTSLGNLDFGGFNEEKIWKLSSIDFSQIHIYGYRGTAFDIVDYINYKVPRYITKYHKPCLIGEYGLDSTNNDKIYDAVGKGIHIHNSLWASLFSQAPAGAMNWWWDSYIDAKNLYGHFKIFSKFVRSLNLPKNGWEMAKFHIYTEKNKEMEALDSRDVIIITADDWGSKDERIIEILNDGGLKGGRLNAYLHGMSKRDLRVSPVFKVDYPEKGKFIITVVEVSAYAVLNVYVDGKKVFAREFPKEASDGSGDWEKKHYRKKWDIYQYEYNEDCRVDIPQGQHTIRLENTGEDWIFIEKIVLTNYKKEAFVNIRGLGLQQDNEAMFWIQNKQSNWYNNYKGIEPKMTKKAILKVLDLPDGEYDIEWWDTWRGRTVYKGKTTSADRGMIVEIPEFERDIALRINRVDP